MKPEESRANLVCSIKFSSPDGVMVWVRNPASLMVGKYLFDLEFDCYARHDEVRLHKPIDTSLPLTRTCIIGLKNGCDSVTGYKPLTLGLVRSNELTMWGFIGLFSPARPAVTLAIRGPSHRQHSISSVSINTMILPVAFSTHLLPTIMVEAKTWERNQSNQILAGNNILHDGRLK